MNKLSERNLVVAQPSGEDARSMLASITSEGKALMCKIAPQHVADVRRLFFDGLTKRQVANMADVFSVITPRLNSSE